jgi:para-nitrobenzyl esterase
MRKAILTIVLAACGSDGADHMTHDAPAALQCTPITGPATERVITTSGVLRGSRDGETLAFKRVPFAAPPTGHARFAPPQPATCAEREIDATAFGPQCPQLADGTFVGDEDCLQLNVWAPVAASAPRPVMVWIHGGGNAIGSAVLPLYDGRRLAEAGDVIVVSANYRLGQLGFLGHPSFGTGSGVFGLLDQIAALAWVRDNIAAFGGDPANVTVFGESAGARDVCSLVASPAARGLFHRAIVQSGACKGLPTRARAEQIASDAVSAAGCSSASDVAACMRALSAEAVIRAAAPTVSILASSPYQPMIDGVVQTDQPSTVIAAGGHARVPLIVGANADETASAVPAIPTEAQYESLVRAQYPQPLADLALQRYPASAFPTPRAAYVRLTTDSRFVCPSREIARAADAGQTEAVYRYFFQYRPTPLGAAHGLEIPYVFGTFDAVKLPNGGTYQPTATDLTVSSALQRDFARFARSADPQGWPLFGSADPAFVIDAMTSTTEGIRTAQCDFWKPYYDAI